jgi:hypothetical protein
MPMRLRLLSLILPLILAPMRLGAANLDGSSAADGDAEAARLYARANDYVSNMREGSYSYAYLQFYWKRAQANIDRIRHVYPDSPTAKALARGDLKIGPYPLDYFRDRVLYNLETKQLGSFEDINCAIFLFSLDTKRSDKVRDQARLEIAEVLAHRQRWEEALRFPVPDDRRAQLLATIFRVAAFDDHPEMVERMLRTTPQRWRDAAGFNAIIAEAMALQGKPRSELYAFVGSHPQADVRAAALRGIIERERTIARMARLRIPVEENIKTSHFLVEHVALRDQVPEVAAQIYSGDLGAAAPLLSVYFASTGRAPAAAAPAEAHEAYLQYLFDSERMGDVGTYASDNGLGGEARRASDLKVIGLYAEAGQMQDAEKARKAFAADFSAGADEASLAEFLGRLDMPDAPVVAYAKTFADLPITDPCVLATAIMEWSMSPNRSQRGATPWDAVVQKYAGGFDNLPMPKSSAVRDAASAMKPY